MARKEKKYHFIYKTTNLLSGKYYIGMHSTDNLNDGYMGSGKRLKRSLNKYGKENHKTEVLEFLNSKEELKKREEEIVNLNEIAKEKCMNLKVGGTGGFSVESAKRGTMKMIKIITEKKKNDLNFYNKWKKSVSDSLKERHRQGKIKYDTFTGKKHSEESKNKTGEANKIKQKGELNSQFGTCWITKDGINKKIKKEVIESYNKDGWVKGRR
jgi:hypothetical protein